MPRWGVAPVLFLCSACAVPQTVETLQREGPPPELGRPGVVRFFASTGAWIGAIGGAAVSVVMLPITWPLGEFAAEPLGRAKTEFVWFPVTILASSGHFLLGAPPDAFDFVFRRAWFGDAYRPDYEYTPMKPPVGPESGDEATESAPPAAEQDEEPAPARDAQRPDPSEKK